MLELSLDFSIPTYFLRILKNYYKSGIEIFLNLLLRQKVDWECLFNEVITVYSIFIYCQLEYVPFCILKALQKITLLRKPQKSLKTTL